MPTVKSTQWRALVHGVVLGRMAYRSGGGFDDVDLKPLREQNLWLRQKNIVGVCIGRKVKDGKVGALCLQVLVKKKYQNERKMPDECTLIPKHIDASRVLPMKKLPTDVRAVGSISPDFLASGTRPARPGYAIGGTSGGFGTIGCAVQAADGRLLGLTCAHVIADDGKAPIHSRIFVPSQGLANDLGVAAPDFGRLEQTSKIDFTQQAALTNLDAALFAPDDQKLFERKIAIWDNTPSKIAANVADGQLVFKVGAATDRTWGKVIGRHAAITIPYAGGDAKFLDQIAISSFTDSGDSGSLVLTADGRAVGLHFASSDGASICTPISRVLSTFGVTLAKHD